MRKGAESFAGLSAFAVPAVVLFVLVSGNTWGFGALVGLFFVLQFCNRLDARSIREGSPR